MKTKKYLVVGLLITVLASISLATFVSAQDSSDSQPDGTSAPSQASQTPGNDSNPEGPPEVVIPAKYSPETVEAPEVLAETTVYFTPQDENSSATILFLYNTSSVTATVGIETFRLSGVTYINTNVVVPPSNLVRISADSVNTVSSSWQDVVLINFTTNSTYARMTLPDGVKAEGYVVWNDSSTYDPLQVAPTLPLRFSTDPLALFLPVTHKE